MKNFFKAVMNGEKKAIALLGMVMSIVLALVAGTLQAWRNKRIEKANFQHALDEGNEFVELCNNLIDRLPAEQGHLKNSLREARGLTYSYVAGQYPIDPYRIKQVKRWSCQLEAHQDDPATLYGIVNKILGTV